MKVVMLTQTYWRRQKLIPGQTVDLPAAIAERWCKARRPLARMVASGTHEAEKRVLKPRRAPPGEIAKYATVQPGELEALRQNAQPPADPPAEPQGQQASGTADEAEDDGFETMTVGHLRAIASNRGIEHRGLRKAQLIETLRSIPGG